MLVILKGMATLLTNFLWWEDLSPRSMLVSDGKVVVAPTEATLSGEEVIDCGGKVLLPKFIDGHCHILPTGLDLMKLNLSSCATREDVFDALRTRLADTDGWLLAVQYDQTKFADKRHITRDELDSISASTPILLRHYNGHASVCNSAAFAAAGIGEDVQNPTGGEFERDAAGRLNGVLLEIAHELMWERTPSVNREGMVEAILAAGEKMADLGIGMAADMMTGRFNLVDEIWAYQEAAKRGCRIRTRLYVQWRDVFGPRGIGLEAFRQLEQECADHDHTKIAGIKLFADGAIGSATAAIYGSYTGAEANGPKVSHHGHSTKAEGTSGQLIYAPEKLKEMTRIASDAGYQVAIHAIGDYATDLVLDAFEATGCPERHRLEHAMILSDALIERIKKLNPFVTFQPEFLMRFGHAYRHQLGEERTALLKRARSVIDAGIRLSFSSDRPIVPGDPLDGIRAAVHRPEGFDRSENVSLAEAIRAYTQESALVCGDEQGALKVGQWADYQLIERQQFETL